VTDLVGVGEEEIIAGLYPNPARDLVMVTIPCGPGTLKVRMTDLTGRKMLSMEHESPSPSFNIDVSAFPPGVYLVNLQCGEYTATRKLVINRK